MMEREMVEVKLCTICGKVIPRKKSESLAVYQHRLWCGVGKEAHERSETLEEYTRRKAQKESDSTKG